MLMLIFTFVLLLKSDKEKHLKKGSEGKSTIYRNPLYDPGLKIRQPLQYILQSDPYISAQTINRMDEPDFLHLQEPNCI